MKASLFVSTVALTLSIISCESKAPAVSEPTPPKEKPMESPKPLNSYVSIFEIPATDITRAINFYHEILGLEIEQMEFPGMAMGLFPFQDQLVTGVIMQGEGYEPSAGGVTLYLNGGDDLQPILDKVETHGGKIIVPKSPHADESGFFAIFLDSEGNKMGLHSLH